MSRARRNGRRVCAVAAYALALASGCATQDIQVTEAALTERAEARVVGWTADSEPRLVFSPEDETITIKVRFAFNYRAVYEWYKVEWVAPGGVPYKVVSLRTDFGSHRNLKATLQVRGKMASRMPGLWRVRIWHLGRDDNPDRLLVARLFRIQEPTPEMLAVGLTPVDPPSSDAARPLAEPLDRGRRASPPGATAAAPPRAAEATPAARRVAVAADPVAYIPSPPPTIEPDGMVQPAPPAAPPPLAGAAAAAPPRAAEVAPAARRVAVAADPAAYIPSPAPVASAPPSAVAPASGRPAPGFPEGLLVPQAVGLPPGSVRVPSAPVNVAPGGAPAPDAAGSRPATDPTLAAAPGLESLDAAATRDDAGVASVSVDATPAPAGAPLKPLFKRDFPGCPPLYYRPGPGCVEQAPEE